MREIRSTSAQADDDRRRPGCTLSATSLGKIIETELGLTVELDE